MNAPTRIVVLLLACLTCETAWSQTNFRAVDRVNYEDAPILYSGRTPNDAIIELQSRIAQGQVTLDQTSPHALLRSLLEALEIPTESQVVTFAHTSLQADKITPTNPRAIYFNDSIHIGHMQTGLIEIAAVDPELGMSFYTLDPAGENGPQFLRETNRCLTCHGAGKTLYVPGLQVRSVFPDPKGHPVISAGSARTNHNSPFEERWGGWYVTGTHGAMRHRGNLFLPDDSKPTTIDLESGANRTEFPSEIPVDATLTRHSDIVALMVLEHQVDAINLITLARFVEARTAADVEAARDAGDATQAEASREERLNKIAVQLADYLTFKDEFRLTDPVRGTSGFAPWFSQQGTRDEQGVSLRDFDLQSRLFKLRCSYLIETEVYLSLPVEVRSRVAERIKSNLLEPSETPEETAARQQTLAHLQQTHADFQP